MSNLSRSSAKTARLSFEALEPRTVLSATSPFDLTAELISSYESPPTETEFMANGISSAANDSLIKKQYGLDVTQTDQAWDLTIGSTEVTVAVIDTGVDYLHPDLYLNIWINQQEIPPAIRLLLTDIDGDELVTFWDLNDPINIGPTTITDLNGTGYIDGGDLLFPIDIGGWADGSDNGQNGFVDDLLGWDFGDNDNDPRSLDPHGTWVAGVIGAVGNNDLGVAGVNWQVQIMPVKIAVGANRIVSGEAAIEGIYYAVDNGAQISNNSYGGLASNFPSEIVAAGREAVDYAAVHDHLLVASAGNDALDDDIALHIPSGYDAPNVISVAATDRLDRLAKFSNFGAISVDLGAPGVGIWTTSLDGRYAKLDGTSLASPHVAGAAALVLSLNPDLSATEIKSLILDNGDPLPDLDGITVTGGRLNVFKAVSAAAESAVATTASFASIPVLDDSPLVHSFAGSNRVQIVRLAPELDWSSVNTANDLLLMQTSEAATIALDRALEQQDSFHRLLVPDSAAELAAIDVWATLAEDQSIGRLL